MNINVDLQAVDPDRVYREFSESLTNWIVAEPSLEEIVMEAVKNEPEFEKPGPEDKGDEAEPSHTKPDPLTPIGPTPPTDLPL